MSHKAQYRTLFAYHGVTLGKLFNTAENLSEAEYRQQIPHSQGSLHDMLFHVLFWLHNWRDGLETNYASPGLQAADFATLASLRTGIEAELAEWQRLLATFEEEDFATERNLGGANFVLWRILQHLITHGMQHQAEAAYFLTTKGYSPGGIDFIWYTG